MKNRNYSFKDKLSNGIMLVLAFIVSVLTAPIGLIKKQMKKNKKNSPTATESNTDAPLIMRVEGAAPLDFSSLEAPGGTEAQATDTFCKAADIASPDPFYAPYEATPMPAQGARQQALYHDSAEQQLGLHHAVDYPQEEARSGGLSKRARVALISAASVIIVITLAGALTVNHFLNKINFSKDKDFSFTEPSYYVPVTQARKTIVLASGKILYLDQYKKINDTTYDLGDGSYATDDGILYNSDGTIILANGSVIRRDGTILLPDNRVIDNLGLLVLSTRRIMLPDNYVIEASSLCVDPSGSVSVITGGLLTPTEEELREAERLRAETRENGAATPSEFFSAPPSTDPPVDPQTGAPLPPQSPQSPQQPPNNPAPMTPEELGPAIDLSLETPKVKWEFSTNDLLIDENLTKPVASNPKVLNYLVAGIDYGSKSLPQGRSDSMIVVSINTEAKTVKLISFSRAAYVKIFGVDMRTRLNSAHGLGGPGLMVDTIESNYKIKIDNYFTVGFDAFKTVIDILGGIPMELTKAEANALKKPIKASGQKFKGAGTYTLTGDLALNYVRLRSIDTDKERTGRQRKVLEKMAQMATSMSIGQLSDLANKLLPLITTDMSKSGILYNMSKLKTYLSWPREQYVIPHKSSNLMLSASGYDVVLINWPDEVEHLKKLVYGDLPVNYQYK